MKANRTSANGIPPNIESLDHLLCLHRYFSITTNTAHALSSSFQVANFRPCSFCNRMDYATKNILRLRHHVNIMAESPEESDAD